jgi:hypothetical protein
METQERLIDRVREHARIEYRLNDDYFKDVYLSEYEGCVPDNRISDDLLKDIEDKFYHIVGAVRDLVEEDLDKEEKRGEHDFAEVCINTSYEDCSSVLVIFKKHLVYAEHTKAWHYQWQSEAEMEEYLQEVYQTLKNNIEAVMNGRDPE